MQSKKMSRAARIICLVFVCVMAMTAMSFAATSTQGLKITKTYPENNATGRSKDNMCVKLYFNHTVSTAAAKKANKDAFSFKDEKGHTLPSRILYSKKNKKYVLVIVDTTELSKENKTDLLQDDTKYICTIKADFRDDEGNTLGEDHVISFRTMNQKRNNMIYMIMMFVMMGGMVVFSVIQVRRDTEKKEKEIIEKGGTFNPYKEAKETGKSVQEVVAKHEAELKKAEAKRAKEKEEEREEQLESEGVYRVKRPHPAREGGSRYKSGMKARYEEQRRREEQAKAERKANNYAKKNKKQNNQQQKKKNNKKGGRK
jgi:hypothetical protein